MCNIPEDNIIKDPAADGAPAERAAKKLQVLDIDEDIRTVTHRDSRRRADTDVCSSLTGKHMPAGDPQLFVEPEAVEAILTFTGWGGVTNENRVEQAALMYGRLCECPASAGSITRWGEVCGIIPAMVENATPVSIEIPAAEWNRMESELDRLNVEAEAAGRETFVKLGWLHTHPFQLDPYFSMVDVELQRRLMNNPELFGLVVNPHRQIFACYNSTDPRPCHGVFMLNDELTRRWDFRTKSRFDPKVVDPVFSAVDAEPAVLTMKAARKERRSNGENDRIPLFCHRIHRNGVVDSAGLSSPRSTLSIASDELRFIYDVLKRSAMPYDSIATVCLSNSGGEYIPELMGLVHRDHFNVLRERMRPVWRDYYYAAIIYNGSRIGMINTMRSLAYHLKIYCYTGRLAPTAVMLINEEPFEVHLMCPAKDI